ncbi:hypothetical protein J25TS5_38420 [Paenibacillus faecis]|nr:hypothetical protein J25TS5_38420 [Paenibacillus faecis]
MKEAWNQGKAEDEDEQVFFGHIIPVLIFVIFGIPADFAGSIIARTCLGDRRAGANLDRR